jgi:hypothetical protein
MLGLTMPNGFMDYVNIVVHVFQNTFVNITTSKAYGDAKITTIENKY